MNENRVKCQLVVRILVSSKGAPQSEDNRDVVNNENYVNARREGKRSTQDFLWALG